MPIKYIPYFPDTVEGQAILDNFTRSRRVLKYRDNDLSDKIKRGMPYYTADLIEKIGEQDAKNLVIRGECLSACAYLKDNGVKVDLVYIDPPFASGADYAKKVFLRRNPKIAEALEKKESELASEQEMDIDEIRSFEEKMYGDIWNKESYLNWMYENLLAIKSIMSDMASIYVHLDWHIGHYVKILMDEVFGEDNFKNEIAYGYRIQGINQNCWPRKHDVIFYYSKTDDSIFHAEKETVIYEKPFIDTKLKAPNFSKLTNEDIEAIKYAIDNGKSIKDKYKSLLFNSYYSEVFVRDVWDCDLTKPIISGSSEYLGYATQKAEGLLSRIIEASSNEGMIVADFFGGSGVTAKVANDLKRNFIHVDIGINSIQTTRDRLYAAEASFEVLDIKDGVNLYRNPIQTMEKLKTLISGLGNEESLDKFWEGAIQDSERGMIPVYLPNLLDHTTKLLDVPLMNRIINEALPDLPDGVKKVVVYYIDIYDRDQIKTFIEDYAPIEIELRDLKEILDETIISDIVDFELKELDGRYIIEFKKFISDRLIRKIDEFNQKGKVQTKIENDDDTEEEPKRKNKFKEIEISENGLELIEYISLDYIASSGVWHSSHEIKIDKNGYIIINGNKTKKFWTAEIQCSEKPLRMKIRNIAGDESVHNF